MIKISAAIIAFNEEEKIARCLQSLQGIADEIVVVDSLSTDRTVAICEQLGARVVSQAFLGHVEQKNFALDQTTHPYIISLDADEVLSEELKKEVLRVKRNWIGPAYIFNRLTNYNGEWIKHCGWYPDRKLRLAEKKAVRWQGENPHDILVLNQGKALPLKGNLLHYSYDSISDHIEQTNRFTTISAHANHKIGVKSNWFKVVTRPPLKFVRDYIFKRGFLDGRYGLIICVINALSAFLKYSKIYELQRGRRID